MKKLAIMFVMLLGSVATIQAQSNTTFDFSCITAAEQQAIDDAAAEAAAAAEVAAEAASELALGFDRNQLPLFTAEDIDALPTGFVQGGAASDLPGDNGRVPNVNHYGQTVRVSGRLPIAITIQAIDNDGITTYEVDRNDDYFMNPVLLSTTDFDEAVAFANALVTGLSDDDENGFIGFEEVALSDASFNVPNPNNPGIYSRTYTISHGDATEVSIIFLNGQFVVQGDDFYSPSEYPFNTLAEAIAFLDAFDFSSL